MTRETYSQAIKLCECGCGLPTTVSKSNDAKKGRIKGQAMRFIKNHYFRKVKFIFEGPNSSSWRGGRIKRIHGYISVKSKDHPSADMNGYVYEHIVVAEKAIGHFLPEKAEIHHINEIRDDNRSSNLVICQNHAYHLLLHARLRAWKATGNANARICWICRQYDNPTNLQYVSTRHMAYHRECNRISCSQRGKAKRATKL